jgi:O-antigen ligase
VATGLIVLGVPISVSRSSVLVLVVATLFLVAAWSPQMVRRSAVVGVVGVLVFRAAVPSLLGTLKSLFTNLGNDPSISGRTDDYETVFLYINERPWLGRGPGTFGPTNYILLDNEILGTIVMQGYIGLAGYLFVFLAAIFVAMRLAFRGPSNEIRHLSVTLGGALTASTMSLYFADMSFFAHWISPTFLMVGLAGALDRVRHEPSQAAIETDAYLKDRRKVRRPPPVA